MGLLDMVHGYDDINQLLDGEPDGALGTDLQALNRATKQRRAGNEIDVGESGTLYRFLQFAAWRAVGCSFYSARQGCEITFARPEAAAKSWPKFWDILLQLKL